MEEKEFRYDSEKAKEHMGKIFPDEKVRKCYLNLISECAMTASSINNSNWNVNLSDNYIQFNCGNRIIFKMKKESLLIMCRRDSFLELKEEFINDFLEKVPPDKEEYKTYKGLAGIPQDKLWNNSFTFDIPPQLWTENYAQKLLPSVLDFCRDSTNNSSIGGTMRTAHSKGFIDYLNSELGTNIPQPEYVMAQGNTQMTKQDEFVEKYTTLLKNTKNLILTGAPGTGKSHLAKQIAEAMGCEEENIGFVQFHPSYDYTDFVEGLRPTDKDGNGNVGFERKDGVFKEFCERALKNLVDSSKTAEEVADEESLKDKINQYLENILDENKPLRLLNGNDFFITDFDENKLNISNPNNEKTSELQVSINDIFLLLSNNVELKNVRDIKKYFGRTWATQQDSYVFILCKEIEKIQTTKAEITEKIPLKNFVFIIDEINRGEVAKIFGELFYSVDPGYRVTYDDLDAIKNGNKTVTTIKTQYANLENEGNIFDRVLQKKEKDFGHFFIPENVYIIGTMNDIDRSVESMDFAFRRRFTWAEVKAEDTQYMLDAELDAVLADEAKRRMENLNSAISGIEGLGTTYHIGASYFLKLDNYDRDFDQLWKYHLKGILEEYLRGNPEKDELMKQLEKAYQE